MIVTILIPDDWTVSDVASSCNIGIRAYAEKERRQLSAMAYNAMVIEQFQLSQPYTRPPAFDPNDMPI